MKVQSEKETSQTKMYENRCLQKILVCLFIKRSSSLSFSCLEFSLPRFGLKIWKQRTNPEHITLLFDYSDITNSFNAVLLSS